MNMQKLIGVAAAVLAIASMSTSAGEFLLRDGDRVVFYGDSITDSEWYPTLVETYVLTRHPTWRNHFSNRGQSGDNSGSIARFERDVLAQKPDVFTYNMGFNDGGYASLRPAGLEKWLENIEKSVELARQANPKMRLALLSPIPNEPSLSTDPRWVSHEVYPYTMLAFGREEEKLAGRLGVPFVDVGLLYGQSMGLGKVAAGPAFQLSRDGVHPQREGQTLIAFHVLRGLGADSLVAEVAIDAAAVTILTQRNCSVTELAAEGGGIRFRRACASLPYPTPPEARPFAFLTRIDDHLNADLLTVKGLTDPAYALFVDDQKIADVAASELAGGVNLSRYVDTPMYAQAMAVMDAVRQKQVAEFSFWSRYIRSGKADGAGQPADTATPEERTAMAAALKAIVDKEAACYAINTPRPHAIRLEPSTAKVSRFAALGAAEINRAPLDFAVSRLEIDWNQMSLQSKEATVTISNPADAPRSGTLSWICRDGWKLAPAEAPFTVEAGKKVELKFTVSAAGGATLIPPPEFTARWRWSKDYPYPMSVTRVMELTPHLAIPRAAVKPTLTGNMEEWKDATTVVLDRLFFVDPAVPGKKPLWGGPEDLSGKFLLKWDDSALYVAALVKDDEHLQRASEMMMWSEDCLMLSFLMPEAGKPDGRLECVLAAYPDRDAVCPTIRNPPQAAGADIQFKSRVDPKTGTCLYEVAIPWSSLPPFVPAPGKTFRFTLCVGEADSQPGKGFNYLAWTHGINYGKNPADFAIITLVPR
jgi:lysophospholipase L1-like esterase